MCWVMPPASPAVTSVVADRVEQRGLAVIDVAHHGHDRRADDEVGLVVVVGGLVVDLLAGVDDLDLDCSNSSASTSTVSSVSVWVRVAISPCCISFLITSARADAEGLGDLADGGAGVDLQRSRSSSALGGS